ncbi:MAG TPA: dihydroorotate dehydrogenase [Thermofilum sp.]|nr:dihydroorotate dehydrogenase [Thermofilum sp.]
MVEPDLSTEIAGIKFKHPLMIASGILGTSFGLMKRVEKAGASGVVTKTFTARPREGNPNPVIVKVNCGYLNSIGLSNPGIDYFASEILNKGRPINIPLILSIGPSNVEEAEYIANRAGNLPVDGLELNVSCPHVKRGGLEIISDTDALRNMIRAIKRRTSRPLFVKLSAMVSDIVEYGELAVNSGADGLVVINTLKGMSIDIVSKKPILGGIYGGLSGPAIKPIAVRCVYELYENLPETPIIGVGGITTWKDVVEFILAGASALQLGTIIAYKGLEIFGKIVEKLKKYMKRERMLSMSEMIGLSH